MKKLTIILASLALVFGMAQCKKENKQNVLDNVEGFNASVVATNGGNEKTEIFPSGLTQWTSGDKIYVVGSTDGFLGVLTTVNYTTASNWATFGGNITEPTAQTQTLHFYYFGKTNVNISDTTYTYSIASQVGTLDSIENTMHLMHGSVANITAGTTNFGNVTMHNMMAIAKFDICGYASPAKCCNAISSRTLNLKTGEWIDNGTVGDITLTNPTTAYYMALIPSTTSQTLTFSNINNTYQVTKNKVIAAGKLYTDHGNSIRVRSVMFSVSDSLTVSFSPSNLQYQASTDTWRFAEHQYDYVGDASHGNVYVNGTKCNNESAASNYSGWIDLFGWGCTGHKDNRTNASTYQTNYFPYSTSTSTVNTTYNYYGYGPDYRSSTKYSLTVASRSDWGYLSINNPITGTADISGTWRTLTHAEWVYLLNTRTVNGGTGEGHSYQRTTLTLNDASTVYGLLLMPDYFTGSVSTTTSWSDWQNLENDGVVFLPAGGYRKVHAEVANAGSYGYYWSVTCVDCRDAYFLNFYSDSVNPSYIFYRCNGRLVRLVKDIK